MYLVHGLYFLSHCRIQIQIFLVRGHSQPSVPDPLADGSHLVLHYQAAEDLWSNLRSSVAAR
uniref:Uncharacterized protein n=1 Tax=Amphimedon queenslandica TaxID=400682 RepID=A0A1X7VAX5_AMPQE